MDALSSATQVLANAVTTTAAVGRAEAAAAGESELMSFRGVALTIPFVVHVGVLRKAEGDINQLAHSIIDAAFKEGEAVFSPFFPESEVCAINKAAGGVWLPVSRDMFEVLRLCQKLCVASGGCFDPTAVQLGKWYVQHVEAQQQGDDEVDATTPELVALRELVGFSRVIELKGNSAAGGHLKKLSRSVSIDVSAVAKGFIVDRLIERFLENLFLDVFVEWGGDLRIAGCRSSCRPWRAGIQDPADVNVALCTVDLKDDASLCTSGDYNQVYSRGYFHITHPLTQLPLKQHASIASVSVVLHGACAIADGLATALLVAAHSGGLDAIRNLLATLGALLFENSSAIEDVIVVQRGEGGKCTASHVTASSAACASDSQPTAAAAAVFSPIAPKPEPAPLPFFDGSALRALMLCAPRSVVLMFLGDIGVVLSSVVQLSRRRFVFFLQRESAIAALLGARSGPSAVRSGSLVVLGSTNGAAAVQLCELYAAGRTAAAPLSTPTPGVLRVLDCAIEPWSCDGGEELVVGDHVCCVAECSEDFDIAASFPPFTPFLMRAFRKYVYLGVPKPPPASPSAAVLLLPRCATVATVSHVVSSGRDGDDVVVVVSKFLGCVLHAVDLTSRRPPILTACMPPGELSEELFGGSVSNNKSNTTTATTVVVRLHILTDNSDARNLRDWFGDVHCTKTPQQFMFFKPPDLKRLKHIAYPPSGVDPVEPPRHVDYRFSEEVTCGYIDCVLRAVNLDKLSGVRVLQLTPRVAVTVNEKLLSSTALYGFK